MIAGKKHYWPVRVYFEDTDAGGIVYHAAYLRFAERGRTEALRELGAPHQELVEGLGLIFVVRRIKVDYLAPARVDDLLMVATELLSLGGASLTLRQTVQAADGAARAVLEVLLVCVRLGTGAPVRLPARWRGALAGLLAGKVEA